MMNACEGFGIDVRQVACPEVAELTNKFLKWHIEHNYVEAFYIMCYIFISYLYHFKISINILFAYELVISKKRDCKCYVTNNVNQKRF